jgi:hypothetical protein
MISNRFVPSAVLYELAFDQFSRQYQAKRLIESVRGKKRLRILDVGGNNGKTREFFPSDDVMVVDLYDVDEPWYVKASALALPFDDNSFDAVVCFDVFEHIAGPDRATFLAEITRVSSNHVIVAAPFNTQYVAESESELNAYYKRVTGNDHRWLKEHIDNVLPERAEVEAFFSSNGIKFQTHSSNNILLWVAMQNLIFLADAVKAPERISALNRFYNEHLATIGDDAEPSYRRIFFASKAGKLPKHSEVTEPVNLNVLRDGINHAAVAMSELIYGERSAAELTQAENLAQKDRELAVLRNQLNDILGSRSYRLAGLFKRTKNIILPRRRE